MIRHSLVALGALTIPAAPSAASDSQIWTTGSATVKLADKWRLSQEFVGRFSDNRKGLYEIESNTMLGYKLNKVTTLWAGYTHDPQYSTDNFTIMEQRAREQVSFDNFALIGKAKLSARLRFEQRWRRGIARRAGGFVLTPRFRCRCEARSRSISATKPSSISIP